jgi:hypothetical protein
MRSFVLRGPAAARVTLDDRTFINFAGSTYLALRESPSGPRPADSGQLTGRGSGTVLWRCVTLALLLSVLLLSELRPDLISILKATYQAFLKSKMS